MNREEILNNLKKPYRKLRNVRFQLSSANALHRIQKKKVEPHKPIRCGFIVQMLEIWDKQRPVFEAMEKDDRFDPYLIVAPSYDFSNSKFQDYGEELVYFQNHYSDDRIIKVDDGSGGWMDLQELHFDYIFYSRCYEHYLPESYNTKNVIRYAKTCYLPYCFHSLKDAASYYETSFFYYIYKFFCCSQAQLDILPAFFQKRSTFQGYPSIENTHPDEGEPEYRNILWTPRWTDEEMFGGTTFFKYLHKIPEIKQQYSQANLTLRPHPLTFPNAVKNGKMTEEEISEYKNRLKKLHIEFDKNVMIADSFAETNILITDFSSILMAYFLTGKPIIYCSRTDVEFSEPYQKIVENSYVARTWDDVMRYVGMLLNGVDPLREGRIGQVRKMIHINQNATQNILNLLAEDSKA